ncbi:MAG: hypothetical protein QM784_17895, partial [Polyangiaceae bacterium]
SSSTSASPIPTRVRRIRRELAVGPFDDFDLYDPAAEKVDAQAATVRARDAERAALASDERLKNSEGATFSRAAGESALVLSSGFVGTKRGTQVSLVVTPVVEDDGGKRRRGYYYSLARHLDDLETAEYVGQEAARRTIAQLGARSVKTCETPIVFSPDAAEASFPPSSDAPSGAQSGAKLATCAAERDRSSPVNE